MSFYLTSKRMTVAGAARSSAKRKPMSGASFISGLDPSLVSFNEMRQAREIRKLEKEEEKPRERNSERSSRRQSQRDKPSSSSSTSSESDSSTTEARQRRTAKSKSRVKNETRATKSKKGVTGTRGAGRLEKNKDKGSSKSSSSELLENAKPAKTRVSDSVRSMAFQIPDPEDIQKQVEQDMKRQRDAEQAAQRERQMKIEQQERLRRQQQQVVDEKTFSVPIVYTTNERPETLFRTRLTAAARPKSSNGNQQQQQQPQPQSSIDFPKNLVDKQYEEMMRRRTEMEEQRRERFLQKLGRLNINRVEPPAAHSSARPADEEPEQQRGGDGDNLEDDVENDENDEAGDDDGRPLSDPGEEINEYDDQEDVLANAATEKHGFVGSRYRMNPEVPMQTSGTAHNASNTPNVSTINAPVPGLSPNVRLTVDISEFNQYDEFHKHQLRQVRRDLESSATLARSVRNMIQIRGKSEEIPLSSLPESLFGYAIMKTFSVGALLTAKRMTLLSCYHYPHPHNPIAPPLQAEISLTSPIRLESIITSGKSVKLMNGVTAEGRRVVVKWYKGEKRDVTYEIEGYRRLGSPPPFISGEYRILGDRVIIMEPCTALDGTDDPYEVARQILPQLGKLHRFACHSDIKPGNIMKREVLKDGRRRWEYLMIDLGGIAVERSGFGYRRIVWSPRWTSQPRQRGIITTPLHDFIELGYTMKGIRLLAETDSHADDEPVRSNFSGRLKKFMEVLSKVPPEKSFSDDLRMKLIEIVSRKPTTVQSNKK